MTAADIKKMQASFLREGRTGEDRAILLEICLQLAELNEKFADYFQTLGPPALQTSIGEEQ